MIHLIPLVPEIVNSVDHVGRQISISPPEGLLDIGRRTLLLRQLRQALTEYALGSETYQQIYGEATSRSLGPGDEEAKPLVRMPTYSDLVRDERHDLIKAIKDAGGFLDVALVRAGDSGDAVACRPGSGVGLHASAWPSPTGDGIWLPGRRDSFLWMQELGLKASRRPAGYWESEDNLAEEIAMFVAENWIELSHPETGESYWHNSVSRFEDRRRWAPRVGASAVSPDGCSPLCACR